MRDSRALGLLRELKDVAGQCRHPVRLRGRVDRVRPGDRGGDQDAGCRRCAVRKPAGGGCARHIWQAFQDDRCMRGRPAWAQNGCARTSPEDPCHCPSGTGRCGPRTAGPSASSPSASTPSRPRSATTNPAALAVPGHRRPARRGIRRFHRLPARRRRSPTALPIRRRRPRRPARHRRRTVRRRPRLAAVLPRCSRHQNRIKRLAAS
jgi:hypothetical protein